MYPLGFTTMAEYLERHGYKARIVNLAVLMLNRPGFDVEKAIREMDPVAFGIDLHWMPHAHGSVEIAKICKKYHPNTPVIFGGLTSSFFHEELASYPCIDYVLRGDSTEEPLRRLMAAIRGHGSVADIPNLTWKGPDGSVNVNELSWVPADMNDISLDYSFAMRGVIRYRDMMGSVPFKDWLNYPVCASLTCRGCTHDCVTCGGSASAFRNHFGRDRVAFRDPELLVHDITHIQKYIPGPIFVLNDFLQAGPDYIEAFVKGLGKIGLRNPIGFEFFRPPRGGLLRVPRRAPARLLGRDLRREPRRRGARRLRQEPLHDRAGRGVDPRRAAPRLQALRPLLHDRHPDADGRQRPRDRRVRRRACTSARATTRGCCRSSRRWRRSSTPGSKVFDDPDKYGYTLKARTLEEHRQLLLEPSWRYIMNYESDAMTPAELVDSTYQAAIDVNRVKVDVGVLTEQAAATTETRIGEARVAMARIDEIVAGDPATARAAPGGPPRGDRTPQRVDRVREERPRVAAPGARLPRVQRDRPVVHRDVGRRDRPPPLVSAPCRTRSP